MSALNVGKSLGFCSYSSWFHDKPNLYTTRKSSNCLAYSTDFSNESSTNAANSVLAST